MARTDPQLKLRLSPSLKDWVDKRAEKNRRSLNAEIVHILEGEKERYEASFAPPPAPMSEVDFLEWLKENPPAATEYYQPTEEEVEQERIADLWSRSEFLSNSDILEILKYRLEGKWK